MKLTFTPPALRKGRLELLGWDDRPDPGWVYLSFNPETHVLAGAVGEPAGRGISNATAVQIAGDDVVEEHLSSFASLLYVAATGRQVVQEARAKPNRRVEALGNWEDFLQGMGAPAAPKGQAKVDPKAEVSGVVMSQEAIAPILQRLATARGGYTPKRDSGAHVGAAVSGFAALGMQNLLAKNAGGVKGPDFDLEAAKAALASVGRPSSRAVAWYGTKDAADEVRRNRAQAARSYPILAGMIADSPALGRAVDAGKPIQPLLTERTGLVAAQLKRVGKLTKPLPVEPIFRDRAEVHGVDALGVDRNRRYLVSGQVDLLTSLGTLAKMPADRTPQDDAGWMAFNDILAACAIPLRNAHGFEASKPIRDQRPDDEMLMKVLEPAKGDWARFHAVLAHAADFEPEQFTRANIALTTVDALEVINGFSRSAILPLILTTIEAEGGKVPEPSAEWMGKAERAAFAISCGNAKNIGAELFAGARRYSSRIAALAGAGFGQVPEQPKAPNLVDRYGDEDYPGLTDEWVAPNGLVVRPLLTLAALKQETARLGHCIGMDWGSGNYNYFNKARRGDGHYFSVQTPDGETSFSSVETSGAKGDSFREVLANLRMLQHQGSVNGGRAIPAEAQAAYDAWWTALKAGHIPLRLEEYREWLAQRKELGADVQDEARRVQKITWSSILEADWKDADARRATFDEWRYIIGGQVGKLEEPQGLWRFKEVRDLLGAMSPETAVKLHERARAEAEAKAAAKAAEAAQAAETDTPTP